jgi:hypothetical protein
MVCVPLAEEDVFASRAPWFFGVAAGAFSLGRGVEMPKSIREFDSLPDRIRLHRQADRRGIVVVEGLSDERFVQRITRGRWALFCAGTRNVVISAVKETLALRVDRVAGLVDQDFDKVASTARAHGLPIFWFDNADLEAFLFIGSALNSLVGELSSERKLSTYGGVLAIRKQAITVALEVAALRAVNSEKRLGLPFDNVDLSKKIDHNTLALKRTSYCQALVAADYVEVQHESLREAIETRLECDSPEDTGMAFFSGKDALVVVGVALKSKIGSCDSGVTKVEHLARVLRLSAPTDIANLPPLSDMAAMIDAA